MKKKTTLKITFTKSQLPLINETLEKLTRDLSTQIIDSTQFIIRYNPRGGYYNLYIQCESRKNAQAIKDIHDSYCIERIFES